MHTKHDARVNQVPLSFQTVVTQIMHLLKLNLSFSVNLIVSNSSKNHPNNCVFEKKAGLTVEKKASTAPSAVPQSENQRAGCGVEPWIDAC